MEKKTRNHACENSHLSQLRTASDVSPGYTRCVKRKWAMFSLRGRRLKGKGKGVLGARETLLAPKIPFPVSFKAACHAGQGYVKQDTWHVWKPIFWYMQLYHALLSKRTCGYYLCFFFWFPLFLNFLLFTRHPPPGNRHPRKSPAESQTPREKWRK